MLQAEFTLSPLQKSFDQRQKVLDFFTVSHNHSFVTPQRARPVSPFRHLFRLQRASLGQRCHQIFAR